MYRVVKRIVLTGGPCAGKSSSLELIKNYLNDLGYIIFIIQESATELINSGVKPFGDNAISMLEFQEIILKYQLDKERLIDDIVNKFKEKNIVILYDRGLIDNKAYINQKLFDKLLKKYNINEVDILDKYDLVIHLETAAKGIDYTLDNNKARSEDKEKAKIMDDKTFDAWKYHKNIIKIKCFEDFEEKQKKIIEVIDNNLSNNIRVQNKYLLDNIVYDLNDEVFNITQYYLNGSDELEYRLREVKYKNNCYYYYTIQKKFDNGISHIYLDKRIRKEEFLNLLNVSEIINKVNKYRKFVIINAQKYSLDLFDDGKVLLEGKEKLDYLELKDVTNDEGYLNKNINNNKKFLLVKKNEV